jgi:two-component system nitrogen regulation sensor histidine kinase NtrY
MTLRAKLTFAFALFAALSMLVALVPVSRALSRALEAEYAARLEGAARAIEGEIGRMGASAVESARDLARGPEAEALARDGAQNLLDPAETAGRAAEWMEARGLDVLAVADEHGTVISSGHLPGRAGDVDPELRAVFGSVPSGQAVPALVTRSATEGLESLLAIVAWEPIPTSEPPLRVAAGMALGPRFADRLAAMTGGEVSIQQEGAQRPLSVTPARPSRLPYRVLASFFGAPQARVRSLPIPASGVPLAHVQVTLSAAGLERAHTTVALVFLLTLGAAATAALLLGHLVAGRITRPVEALSAAAREVAAGNLEARVRAKASGEVGQLVAAFNAMTSELAASRERLAAAERIAAWREVARRLAHEIKNPLTPIAMSVDTLRDALEQERPDFREIFQEGTAAIQEEVRRLKRIVDEFSRFARLPRPELVPLPSSELVSSLLALYPAPPPGIALEHDVAPDLPRVNVDRDQILQVLLNLVRNAVEAMGSGGTLRILARREGSEVAISVSDTGPGIRPEDLPSVFEPYFTTKESGTGLGLAIADRIVREHSGRIDVRSRPGEGATFTMRLPVA